MSENLNVSDILANRYSVRAFESTPVADELLQEIFIKAQQAPSNCNVQPWQVNVVSGNTLALLRDKLMTTLMSGAKPNPEFNWKPQYQGIHRERQFGSANALYSALGIAREDKEARQIAMANNWQFFGAPHAAFFTMDKYLDIMGAVDLGIYAQTLSLILAEQGIQSCMQGALGQFPDPVKEVLGIPEERGILFGMSFGYAKADADANRARTDRASIEDAVQFFS